MPPRVPLSAGASTGAKAAFSIAGIFLALVGISCGFVGFGFAYGVQEVINSSGVDGEFHLENGKLVPGPGESSGYAGGVSGVFGFVFMAFGVAIVVMAALLVLKVIRSGAWLEGSKLFERGAVRTKSVDLSTAKISIVAAIRAVGVGDQKTSAAIQTLAAVDPATGRKVLLPLRKGGATILPADQLSMVANAITNQRAKSDEDQAFVIAGRLRDFAKDPFS